MSKRLLIDARQIEETRVITTTNDIIDDFEYEVHSRRQLKGNIYLARVTRVEPSLQAAFIEYGGNRQGFLDFSEIHPDYYRIPVEDKKRLIAEVSAQTDEELKLIENINEDAALDYNEEDLKKVKKNLYRNYKIQEAIVMLNKAYNQKKNDPFIIDSVGWGYYLIGDFVNAENFLRKAIQLMPKDPIVNDHYGDVLWKLNRKIQAKYYWESALNSEDTENKIKSGEYKLVNLN